MFFVIVILPDEEDRCRPAPRRLAPRQPGLTFARQRRSRAGASRGMGCILVELVHGAPPRRNGLRIEKPRFVRQHNRSAGLPEHFDGVAQNMCRQCGNRMQNERSPSFAFQTGKA
jgi:hypothetical protein